MMRRDRSPSGDWFSRFRRFGRSSTKTTNPTIDQANHRARRPQACRRLVSSIWSIVDKIDQSDGRPSRFGGMPQSKKNTRNRGDFGCLFNWREGRGSNPQPPDRQSGALTNCATSPWRFVRALVTRTGRMLAHAPFQCKRFFALRFSRLPALRPGGVRSADGVNYSRSSSPSSNWRPPGPRIERSTITSSIRILPTSDSLTKKPFFLAKSCMRGRSWAAGMK